MENKVVHIEVMTNLHKKQWAQGLSPPEIKDMQIT